MPGLVGANFSGASNSTLSGFEGGNRLELILSGASISQLSSRAVSIEFNLSGASKLTAVGQSSNLVAKVSGASELFAYDLETRSATADASGASEIRVFVSTTLDARADGASIIYYRGSPAVNSTVSGASTVRAD